MSFYLVSQSQSGSSTYTRCLKKKKKVLAESDFQKSALKFQNRRGEKKRG